MKRLSAELRRLREIDEKRWSKFREFSSKWDERAKLLSFLAEIEARLAVEGDIPVADHLLREWIRWAKDKTESLNPFGSGATGMFKTISKVTQWP
ncbi:hypothetical protein V1291_000819 [Nitrobacteraceae bacterium AZCC 1564]